MFIKTGNDIYGVPSYANVDEARELTVTGGTGGTGVITGYFDYQDGSSSENWVFGTYASVSAATTELANIVDALNKGGHWLIDSNGTKAANLDKVSRVQAQQIAANTWQVGLTTLTAHDTVYVGSTYSTEAACTATIEGLLGKRNVI